MHVRTMKKEAADPSEIQEIIHLTISVTNIQAHLHD